MAFEEFVALVALLAVVYAVVVKYVQGKLIDKAEMEGIQAESKRLSAEFDKAKKANNKKRMDEIMEEQMQFLPRMNSVMLKQFRPMIVILAIFFLAVYVVIPYIDPTVKDDIALKMADDGKGCDLVAGDGNYTACYEMGNDTNFGKWTVLVKALDQSGNEVGQNSTLFLYGSNLSDNYSEAPKGAAIGIALDKAYYPAGDTVRITAAAPANTASMVATLDNGTAFHVDLPFAIPIINVQRIQQPYWWFILISLITNLTLTAGMGQYDKMKKSKAK